MAKYLLTIRYEIEALDDMDARTKARTLLEKINIDVLKTEVKFQEILVNKPPRKIEL